uniref:HAT C-terminal dimerisation domain-containing protein n=1 Tax=Lactuca sativa TaxID=4236 RepID=A0A9R1X835_LACSA|nr:hypothetical protein LSAT_V11C600329310 [Lactuca sativa]
MDTNFDILLWWKIQQCRYPILSKMARDILTIPVSTVASESAFSTGGRVLDSFRTSLTPRMVEALVCAQDWLRSSRKPIVIDDILLEIEKLEENGLKELILEQPIIIIDESVDESDVTEELDKKFGYMILVSESVFGFRISDFSDIRNPDTDSDTKILWKNVQISEIRISEFSGIRFSPPLPNRVCSLSGSPWVYWPTAQSRSCLKPIPPNQQTCAHKYHTLASMYR